MNDTIEAATAPGVFSLTDFLAGASYPEEVVTVYLNAYAVNELIKANAQHKEIMDRFANKKPAVRTIAERDPELGLAELSKKIEDLNDQVASSALTFTFRGHSPEFVDALTERVMPTGEGQTYLRYSAEEQLRDRELIVASLVSIVDAKGNTSADPFTEASVTALEKTLLPGEFEKIIVAVANANMNGQLFEQAVDAPFRSGRSNVAGQ